MTEDWREALLALLPHSVASPLAGIDAARAERVQELRFRVGQPAEAVADGKNMLFPPALDNKKMEELVAALCGYARYAYEEQMAQGFIPLAGGHRAGVCGKLTRTPEGRLHMKGVTSVCIRIARNVPGASAPIRPYLLEGSRVRRVLLLGPPGCGKTTVLRDAALYLSDACGMHVGVADEREELFSCGLEPGMAARIDVLAGAEKAQAMRMLLRSMAPQVLVTDEVGRMEDVDALLDASRCGVGLLASAHASALEDVLQRPALRMLHEAKAFEIYLFLGTCGRLAWACGGDGKALTCAEGRPV